jgi:hypothetical protein
MDSEGPFGRVNTALLLRFVFGLFRATSVAARKIGLANSSFMKVGAQTVNLRPGRDNQQLTKPNRMFILIFYMFSRLSDFLTGRQTFLARA